jgi:hypothetical protein
MAYLKKGVNKANGTNVGARRGQKGRGGGTSHIQPRWRCDLIVPLEPFRLAVFPRLGNMEDFVLVHISDEVTEDPD